MKSFIKFLYDYNFDPPNFSTNVIPTNTTGDRHFVLEMEFETSLLLLQSSARRWSR